MSQKRNVIQMGVILGCVSLLLAGCGHGRRQARQELAEEMAQRRYARIQSMKLYQEAMSEYQARNVSKAHALLRQSVEVNSRNASAWVALGVLEYEKNNLFDAARAMNEALRLEPHRFEPHYNMGLIYETAGKYSQAVTSYEKALQIAPDETAVMENLIRCYIKIGHRQDETLQLIDRALLLEQRPHWREWLEIQKTGFLQKEG